MIKLTTIKPNPNNPRLIKDYRFEKLCNSIKELPKMMKLRPIIVDEIEYRSISGYKGYLFGNDGSVISYRHNRIIEVIGTFDKDGYLRITLVDENGKFKYFRKHRLIALAFLGHSNLQINHKDSNKINNHIDNLEYVTLRENQSHRRLKEGHDIGVCWAKKEKKWRSYIQYKKQWEHLGFYEKKEQAKQAYINRLNELKIDNKYAK